MADIRINSLPTTASASSSDDYIALDGTTNGTRKLNAYSPTFGGNLTVSGTSALSGAVKLGSGSAVALGAQAVVVDAGSEMRLQLNSTDRPGIYFTAAGSNLATMRVNSTAFELLTTSGTPISISQSTLATTLAGNLTVSGTGNSSVAGTLLVATTTNSSNGKLQLATHTTSAGGIGLGTALSIYRSSDNSAWVDALSGNVQLVLGRAGTANLAVLSDGSNVYASAAQAGMGMIFRTNGSTTALTLDSSQNATFAGTVTATGSMSTSKAVVGGSVVLSARNTDNTNSVSAAVAQLTVGGASAGDPRLLFTIDAVQDWSVGVDNSDGDKFKIGPSSSVGTSTSLTLDPTTGNATFAGAIAIGNTVNTVSPTSPNRTITMVIGGTTYYIHAKTTND